MKETVAVLGTGKIGTALARAFAAAGHSVVAWNRTPARAEPLRTVATLASTPVYAAAVAAPAALASARLAAAAARVGAKSNVCGRECGRPPPKWPLYLLRLALRLLRGG